MTTTAIVEHVDRLNRQIKWQGEKIFIAGPLVGEVIGLCENDDGNAEAYFGPTAVAPGEQVVTDLIGPPTTAYVDSTTCRLVGQ